MDENDKLIALFSTRVRQLLLLVEKLRKENKEQAKEIKRLTEMNEFLEEASAFFAARRQKSGKSKD